MMILSLGTGVAAAGSGTSEADPILIGTADELKALAAEISADGNGGAGKFYQLTADIDFGGAVWSSYIGTKDKPFKGTFDGNGKVIKNFTVNIPAETASGIFGIISGNAYIHSVGVENVVANYTVDLWQTAYGGLVGKMENNSRVEMCYAKDVKITTQFGGGQFKFGAGLVGHMQDPGTAVRNCYATNITFVGEVDYNSGLVGGISKDKSSVNPNGAVIENCYSDLTLVRSDIGQASGVRNSFFSADAPWPFENPDSGDGYYAGTKVSIGTLKNKAADLGDAFAEDNGMTLKNNGFPILKWQIDPKEGTGDAAIEASTPENGAEEISPFNVTVTIVTDRYIKTADVLADGGIVVTPEAEFNVADSGKEYTDTVKIVFPQLGFNTEYTISFGENVKTIADCGITGSVAFKTMSDRPSFEVVETTPASGTTGIADEGASVKASYSLPIDFDTVDGSITVTPNASFDVKKGANDFEIEISFTEKLKPLTQYTLDFTSDVKSIYGDAGAASSMTFTTKKGFANLVKNGDMENTSRLADFYTSNGDNAGFLSFVSETELKGKTNSVLCLSPGWGDQPVNAVNSITEAGKYYMSAWVKSDEAQRISMTTYIASTDTWSTIAYDLEAGKWTFLDREIDIAAAATEVTIRAVGGKTIYVDDWSIYDISLAPSQKPEIISSAVADGSVGVTPRGLVTEIVFNVPVRQGTLKDIKFSDNSKIKKIDFDTSDLKKCTVEFNSLDNGADYTLDLRAVKSMSGEALSNGIIRFKTIAVEEKDATVVSTVPANGAAGIRRKDIKIEIVFDLPIEPDSVSNITVTPDIGAAAKVENNDLTKCIIDVNKQLFKSNTVYTVNVPNTVKTINGYSATPYSFTFSTINEADTVKIFNDARGDAAAMKIAVNEIYEEFENKSIPYEYVKASIAASEDKIYELLAVSAEAATLTEVENALNGASLNVILSSDKKEEGMKKILSSSGGIFNKGTEKIYNTWLTNEAQNSVVSTAEANKDKPYTEFVNTVTEDIICKSFKCIGGAKGIEELLKTSKDSFTDSNSIDALLKKADESGKADKIYERLQGIAPNSLSEIKSKLSDAIDAEKDSNNGGGSSGGGGGSSSGSVRGSVYGGVVYSEKPNVEEKSEEIFTDLDSVSWAKENIIRLYNKGIVNGKGIKSYAPNDTLTRAEFAKMAVLASGGFIEGAKADFADVSTSDWSYPYIASAYEMKLILGMGNNMFGGDMSITREDMAVILAKMAENAGMEITSNAIDFSDSAEIFDYAKTAVSYLSSIGIINGTGNGKFSPKSFATRAEAAVIFDRFLQAQ